MVTFILGKAFHASLAEAYLKNIISGSSRFYYYLSRTTAFNIDDTPPELSSTFDQEKDIRDNIFAIKRVNSSDASLVIRRVEWTQGKVFSEYDTGIDLSDKDFYVVTNTLDVYKCLDNANGSPSIVKPTGTPFVPIRTSDGYLWKYMYTIPKILDTKFSSNKYIPVSRALTNRFYDIVGAIGIVDVISGGSNYLSDPVVTASINGNGIGALITPIVDPVDGSIRKVRIDSAGSGYTEASVIISDLSTTPGTGASFYVNIQGGSIVDVFVLTPGSGYSSDIRTTLTVQGDGEGAEVFPLIEGGVITDVIVRNPGSGYTTAEITAIGDGTGAIFSVNFNSGDLTSDQSFIEQTAVPGAVYNVKIDNPGTSYTDIMINVIGDGSGLEVNAIVNSGMIQGVEVINPGQGYSYVNFSITSSTGSGGVLRAIISPENGHGTNAPRELLADTVCLFTTLAQDRFNNIRINNDFRNYGLLENPLQLLNGQPVIGQSVSSMYHITVNDSSDIFPDDICMINGSKFTVLYVGPEGILLVGINNSTIAVDDAISFPGLTVRMASTIISQPQVNKYTGELVYTRSRPGVNFSDEQIITLQSYITL